MCKRLGTARVGSSLIVGVLLALVAVAGCKGKGASSPTAPTPDSIYAGNWVGNLASDTMSRNYVTFAVTASGDLTTSVNVVLIGATIGAGGIVSLFTCDNVMTSTASRIAGSSFDVPITGQYGSTRMTGQFSSSTAATGSIAGFTPNGSCRPSSVSAKSTDTWTARKQ
jgi:hypothetical protein